MTQDQKHTQNQAGYDKHDVSVWSVMVIIVVSVLTIAATVIILYDYFISTKETIMYEQVLSVESETLLKLRARETKELNSYRLLDSTKGVYQIPIEKAMRIVVDEAAGTGNGQ